MHNWSATVTYSSFGLAHPSTLDELSELVATHPRVRAVGSRHSFNNGVDTDGLHISLDQLPSTVAVLGDQVTSSGGMTHAELSGVLADYELALPNMASLPHISVAGAIQTGTHGSGLHNPPLSAGVTALDIVAPSGEVRTVHHSDPDFNAVVVGLGAFGVVHSVTQRVVPAFTVSQTVYENLDWGQFLLHIPEVFGAAYSVSAFTRFDADFVPQIWLKRRCGDEMLMELEALGATRATRVLHPLPDTPSDNVTDQLGRPGRSFDRLPHFRSDFQPGRGDEIQSEYLLELSRAQEAFEAMRGIGHRVGPLLHMAEIRCVAPDDAWMSPSSGRTSVALHFTWRRLPDEVHAVLPLVEAVLMPLGARPHWGKVFRCNRDELTAAYPRIADFREATGHWDPDDKFGNQFLRSVLGPT